MYVQCVYTDTHIALMCSVQPIHACVPTVQVIVCMSVFVCSETCHLRYYSSSTIRFGEELNQLSRGCLEEMSCVIAQIFR